MIKIDINTKIKKDREKTDNRFKLKGKGVYGLAFTLQFNPWSVAINQLRLVYIFSGIVVGLIEDKQITTVMKINEKSEVTADYRCMEQVVSNLLLNAIQHTDIGGTIWISLVEGKVEIENKGAPIPEDKLKLIWNAFYKVQEINNRSGEGSGLGVSIVKNMLELHKLSFGVENTEEGVKFWFNLRRG